MDRPIDPPLTPDQPESPPQTPRRGGAWWASLVIAILGLAVSIYLWQTTLAGGRPPGCGAQASGCAQAWASPWATWLGLPVTGLSTAVYLLIVVFRLTDPRPHPPILCAMGFALIGAAVWFAGLQAYKLDGWCPWCLAVHGLGLTLATLLLAGASARPMLLGAIGGALGVGTLIAGQLLSPPAADPPLIASLPARHEGQSLTLLDGRLTLQLDQEVIVSARGSEPADAPLLIVMFDYACPHCRRAHELSKPLPAHRELLLPVPLSPDCNPYQTPPGHPRLAHSCALAKLLLATHEVSPHAAAAFHDWAFAQDAPPTYDDARAFVNRLVDPAALEQAWQNPAHEQTLQRNIAAWGQSRDARLVGGLPIHLAPDGRLLTGPVSSAESLRPLLEPPALP